MDMDMDMVTTLQIKLKILFNYYQPLKANYYKFKY